MPSFQDAIRANFSIFPAKCEAHVKNKSIPVFLKSYSSLDVVHLILCMLSTYFISYDVFWELFRENASRNITYAGRGLSESHGQFTRGSCRELLQPLKKKKQTNKIRHTRQANKRKQRVLLKNIFSNKKGNCFLAT